MLNQPSTRGLFGKSQRVKTQRVKTSENFAEEKMFAEDISEDFSEKIEDITFTLDFIVFPGMSSKSSRKIAFF